MNDQWSGKTLLSAVRTKSAAPSRRSNQRANRFVAGAGNFVDVTSGPVARRVASVGGARGGRLPPAPFDARPVRLGRSAEELPFVLAEGERPQTRRGTSGSEAKESSVSVPEAGTHRTGEVSARDQIAAAVDRERQLRERARRRSEDGTRTVEHVERRLVTRAQQQARGRLVQADRTTDVGAELGVGDDALDRPVLAPRVGFEVLVR